MNRRALLIGSIAAIPVLRASAQDFPAGSLVNLTYDDGAKLSLKITKTESQSAIDGVPAAGVYQVVWIAVNNIGSKPKRWTPSDLMLIDSANRQFAPNDDLSRSVTIADTGRDPYADSLINPGLSAKYGLVFDVPAGASGLRLLDDDIGFAVAIEGDQLGSGGDFGASAPRSDDAIPVGEVADTGSFSVKVTGATFDTDELLGSSDYLLVMLEVEAIGDGAYGFAGPDDVFTVNSGDGRRFELSRSMTGIVRMSLGQEMMIFVPGRKYPEYLTFALGLHEPGANPVKPTDLTLSYKPAAEGGTEYRFALPV